MHSALTWLNTDKDRNCIHVLTYLLAIRRSVSIPKLPRICKSVLHNSSGRLVFLLQNKPQNLEPSYKMDLDFCVVLKEKNSCLIIKVLWYLFQWKDVSFKDVKVSSWQTAMQFLATRKVRGIVSISM